MVKKRFDVQVTSPDHEAPNTHPTDVWEELYGLNSLSSLPPLLTRQVVILIPGAEAEEELHLFGTSTDELNEKQTLLEKISTAPIEEAIKLNEELAKKAHASFKPSFFKR